MVRPTNQDLQRADQLFAEGLQLCGSCSLTLPVASFGKSRKGRFGLQRNCKDCTNRRNRERYYPKQSEETTERKRQASREWRRNLPDHVRREMDRRSNLKQQYGITLEEYNYMVADQDGRCALCQVPFSAKAKPHVDHDHSTGEIRGVLCHLCNVGVGHFRECSWTLQQAIAYLQH